MKAYDAHRLGNLLGNFGNMVGAYRGNERIQQEKQKEEQKKQRIKQLAEAILGMKDRSPEALKELSAGYDLEEVRQAAVLAKGLEHFSKQEDPDKAFNEWKRKTDYEQEAKAKAKGPDTYDVTTYGQGGDIVKKKIPYGTPFKPAEGRSMEKPEKAKPGEGKDSATIYNVKNPKLTKKVYFTKGTDYEPPSGWTMSKPGEDKSKRADPLDPIQQERFARRMERSYGASELSALDELTSEKALEATDIGIRYWQGGMTASKAALKGKREVDKKYRLQAELDKFPENTWAYTENQAAARAKKYKREGATLDQIAEAMGSSGWSPKEIDAVFKKNRWDESSVTVPKAFRKKSSIALKWLMDNAGMTRGEAVAHLIKNKDKYQ